MKVLSLFSGIGAFEKALTNIGIDYELVNYCEIDKYASKAYSLIHNISEDKNLWDVTKIDTSKLDNFDLLIGSSPCQNISIMRKTFVDNRITEGLKGSQSSLFFEYVRVLDSKQPRYFVFENVRNLLNCNKGDDFKTVVELLGENYNLYYKVLDSKDYGVPQTRRRLFIVGQHKSFGEFQYDFPKETKLTKIVFDLLEDTVDDKYYLTDKMYKIVMSTGTKDWYAKPSTDTEIAKPLVSTMYKMHRPSTDNYYHTEYKPVDKTNLRRLTPLECFRLQGFDDSDYFAIKNKISDTQLYRHCGNSITVAVLEKIFEQLF